MITNFLRFCSPLLCFLMLTSSLKAQQYLPMLTHTKEWLVKTCEFGNCLHDYYWAVGDTNVGGKDYKFLDGYHYNRNFLIREDTTAQKVYTLISFNGQQTEYLLYDFSLQPGDSLYVSNPLSPAIGSAGYYQLDSIRIQTFEGLQRRVFHLSAQDTTNNNPYTKWIEGIGGTSILNAPGELGDTTKLAELLCVSENGRKIYTRFPEDTCYSNPAIGFATAYEYSEASIFYSVESREVYYTVPSRGFTLQIFSLRGEMLRKIPLGRGRGQKCITGENGQRLGLVTLFDPQGVIVKYFKVMF